jgi:Zn-dependent protease with chaperone function
MCGWQQAREPVETIAMRTRATQRAGKDFMAQLFLAALVVFPSVLFGVERLKFKTGFNLFKPHQDVQFGREAAAEADKQLPLLDDPQVVRFINDLGHRLASFAPNNDSDYVWQFKVVNSSDINAFALPGGFIYVNRGAIEAAEDEAQIAGVMAHESGHVVMRHGTHQATEVMLAKVPLTLLSGLLGEDSSLSGQLAELGISFGVNSLMLKNSRSAESQADEVGTYILYHAGYDPHAMAQFFQIIQKKYPQRTIQFFSDHPVPENRIKDVDEEIPLLGPPVAGRTTSPEFDAVKEHLQALPPPPKGKAGQRAVAGSVNPPPAPSSTLVRYDGQGFGIHYPDNWQVKKTDGAVALYPAGGFISGPEGEENQAYGAYITHYQPQGAKGWGLVDATEQLLDSWRESNPNLRVVKQSGMSVQGRPALVTLVENDSPLEGQKETDRVLTLRQSDSLLAVVFVAPQGSFDAYKPTFDAMLESLKIR